MIVRYTDESGVRVEQRQQKQAMGGFESQNDPRLHFGLGAAQGPIDVEVVWPRGNKSGASLAIDQQHTLRESP